MLGQKYNNSNHNSYIIGKKHSNAGYSLGNKTQPLNNKFRKPINDNSTVIMNDRNDEKQREPKGFYKGNKNNTNEVERKLKTKDYYN